MIMQILSESFRADVNKIEDQVFLQAKDKMQMWKIKCLYMFESTGFSPERSRRMSEGREVTPLYTSLSLMALLTASVAECTCNFS
jgi:hypothetical protein